jgi:hypothetical protein
MNKLLKIDDLRRHLFLYFDFEDRLMFGKAINQNLLTYFNFNVTFDNIFDITKTVIDTKTFFCNRYNYDEPRISFGPAHIISRSPKIIEQYMIKENINISQKNDFRYLNIFYNENVLKFDKWVYNTMVFVHPKSIIKLIEKNKTQGREILSFMNNSIDKLLHYNLMEELCADIESEYMSAMTKNIDIHLFCTRCANFGHKHQSNECLMI